MQFARQLVAVRFVRTSLAFTAAIICCICLLCFRTLWTWNFDYAFLFWNLALAAIPLIFTFTFVHFQNTPARAASLFLWMLFLPNAPYIATDFIHLRHFTSGPIWLDLILLLSCSLTGMAIAFYSLSEIHDFFRERNLRRAGWLIVIIASFLSGFAIYLGRFLRWRSIDAFHQPLSLGGNIIALAIDPFQHPRAWGVTIAFGILFSVSYSLLKISLFRPH